MELSRKMQYTSMLKALAIGTILTLTTVSDTFSQTFGEFFNQKKTQNRYLLEQIAALEMYTSYLKKGYQIVGSGLQTIKDLSNGEFNLHDTFISSLKTVRPAVRNNLKIAEIIEMQVRIGKAFNSIKSNPNLSVSYQFYIQKVRENLWEESLKDLEELLLVITSGKLEMGDQERIKRLDNIYLSLREKTAFTQNFTTEVNLFISQKELEKKSIEQLKNSYGIQH